MDVLQGQVWEWLDRTPLAIWIAACLIGAAIELTTRSSRPHAASSRWLNVRYGAVHVTAIFVLSPLCNLAVDATSRQMGFKLLDFGSVSESVLLNQVLTVVAFALVSDFFYYWWHRLQHRCRVLWDQHAVHHSDETVNVTTTMRQHWSEFAFQSLLVSLPAVILVRMDPITIFAISVVMHTWSFFNHADVRLPLGPLAYVVSGPQLHRVHHSTLPEHRDRNFAAYFPVWDLVFGTFHAPRRDEYPPTGLVTGERIDSVFLLSAWPFLMLLGRLMPHRLWRWSAFRFTWTHYRFHVRRESHSKSII